MLTPIKNFFTKAESLDSSFECVNCNKLEEKNSQLEKIIQQVVNEFKNVVTEGLKSLGQKHLSVLDGIWDKSRQMLGT
jgi:hypothetical protein